MANASTKRIAASNEQALRNLQLGLLIVNVSGPPVHPPVLCAPADGTGINMDPTISDLSRQQSILLPSNIPIHSLSALDCWIYLRVEMVCDYRNSNPDWRGYQSRR
jgi:hypothetical protein